MPERTRRYTDHVEHASDHDLLITLNTKINSICESIQSHNEQHKEFINKVDQRCEHRLSLINGNNDKVIGKSMFRWLFGTVIIVLISLFGIIGVTRINSVKNDIQISHNYDLIGKNATAIEQLITKQEISHDYDM